MPEILQKLKSELKSGLSSSNHDEPGNASSRDAQSAAPSGTGGSGVIPADDDVAAGREQSTAAAAAPQSGRQTLRKAAEAEGAGAGSGGSGKKTTGGGVSMTPPSGGVIHSEEAHARDRAQSERMTLRKAAAHDRGDDTGLGA